MTLDSIIESIGVKPFHREPAGVIYCADAADIIDLIPDGAVDVLVADPPYGVNGGSGTKGLLRAHKSAYTKFDDTPEYVKNVIVPIIKKGIAKFGRAVITPGSLCLCCYPNPQSYGNFQQPATCAMQKWGRADSQPIFYYGDDPRRGKTIDFCSHKNIGRPDMKKHPCVKPLDAWRWLINRASLEGEIIYDPFCGSGVTGVIAKNCNRFFIMCEIEEKYCAIAVDRLRQEVLAL